MQEVDKLIAELAKDKELFDLLTTAAHVLFGILTTISARISPLLPLAFFAAFLAYEGDEEKILGDALFEEMREYATGLALGIPLYYLITKKW